jgi:hypothetical protein
MSQSSDKDLIAWQKRAEPVAMIWDATERFPSPGAVGETETQVVIAEPPKYLSSETTTRLTGETR